MDKLQNLHSEENPLFKDFDTLHGAYPFDIIKKEHFLPAFERAIKLKREEVDKIINSDEEPTFENTVLALEDCGEDLERVAGVFFNLLHSLSDDDLNQISEKIIPMLTELGTYISLNEQIFKKVEHVYHQKNEHLDEEDKRLLFRCYEGFVDSGALLPEEKKQSLRKIAQELSLISHNVGQNALKDEKKYKIHLKDMKDLGEMPESALAIARQKAKDKGEEGWIFDLSAPSYSAFMRYCTNPSLRKDIYMAHMTIAAKGDEFDNRKLIVKMANFRRQEAEIMGYRTFADMVLKDRMAKNPTGVYNLLNKLLKAYKPHALEEIKKIESFAFESGFDGDRLQPWDWSYWSEKYMKKYYELDAEMFRPYLKLDKVIDGVFGLANKLYGLSFSLVNLPVYHKDVKVFEVLDEKNEYLGLLYTDFFPRDGKQSGAWMNGFQDQYIMKDGKDHRPHIVLVMNFTPPTDDKPSLLTLGEVNTFLHEFGHALHGLLTKCKYASLSGTSVVRDFVELPSQLMENWCDKEEWLDTFASEVNTGEKIPRELINKLHKAKHFLAAYSCCRQLSFGFLDMAWHTITEDLPEDLDVKDFEYNAWKETLVLPESPKEAVMSPAFGHIFSGGYAAGYYGYKWSEVLDADAFDAFTEKRLFDKEAADRFRREVLEKGDTEDAVVLYRNFRGKEPSIEPLMRRDGIIK